MTRAPSKQNGESIPCDAGHWLKELGTGSGEGGDTRATGQGAVTSLQTMGLREKKGLFYFTSRCKEAESTKRSLRKRVGVP